MFMLLNVFLPYWRFHICFVITYHILPNLTQIWLLVSKPYDGSLFSSRQRTACISFSLKVLWLLYRFSVGREGFNEADKASSEKAPRAASVTQPILLLQTFLKIFCHHSWTIISSNNPRKSEWKQSPQSAVDTFITSRGNKSLLIALKSIMTSSLLTSEHLFSRFCYYIPHSGEDERRL